MKTPEFLWLAPEEKFLKDKKLCSSMQKFETSLLLITVNRWPDALVKCVESIEGLLLYHYKKDPRELQFRFNRGKNSNQKNPFTFYNLIENAQKDFKYPLLSHRGHKLRRMRNEFVHKGFVPADSKKAFEYYFKHALPYLRNAYKEMLGFDLIDRIDVYPGDFRAIMEKTISLCEKSLKRGSAEILIRSLRNYIQPTFVSTKDQFLKEAFEGDTNLQVSYEEMIRDELGKDFDPDAWRFYCGCPVYNCNGDLLCCLSFDGTEEVAISVDKFFCTDCHLHIEEESHPFLAKEFLSKEIEGSRDEIVRDYGFQDINPQK